MSTTELKADVLRYLDKIDDNLLQAIHAMLSTYIKKQDEIVGYHPDGQPMTLIELKESIQMSEEQYKKGQYVSAEELDKKSKEWLNRTK